MGLFWRRKKDEFVSLRLNEPAEVKPEQPPPAVAPPTVEPPAVTVKQEPAPSRSTFTASVLGLETILGAFVAGVILRLVDGDRMMTHPQFRQKLEAIGFGVFIPVFFVASGIRFDLAALLSSPSTIARVPIFLMALLLVRGVPAFLYRPLVGNRRSIVAGLLQATSLSFIVAASQIGLELGLISKATGAALIAAGLLSVLIFPLLALTILRRAKEVSWR